MQNSQHVTNLLQNLQRPFFGHSCTDHVTERSAFHPFHDQIRFRGKDTGVLKLPRPAVRFEWLAEPGIPVEDIIVRVRDPITTTILQQDHDSAFGL